MKTISKRMVCLILSVCISFTVLPIMFSIKANASGSDYNTVPAMIDSEGMLVFSEGVKDSGTYGNNNGTLTLPNLDLGDPKDLSGYDYFEFDYYVEDLDNLKQLSPRIELNFWRSDSVQAAIGFIDLLTKDGWNHLKLSTSTVDGYRSALSATKYIRFKISKNNGVNVGSTDRYRTANLVATVSDYNRVPAMIDSEGMLVLREGTKDSGTYGNANNGRWEPNITLDSATDLTTYDYFEFDYYVENLANLKQLASKLGISIVHNDGGQQCVVEFLDLLTKDGWNHVKVLTSTATGQTSAIRNAKYIRFRIEKKDGITVADADRYKTANLVATVSDYNSVPAMVNYTGMLEIHEGVKDQGTYGSASGTWTPNIDLGSATADLTGYDYFVFDYYVENLANLKQLASNLELNFWKSDSQQAAIRFLDLLTKDGWNHIKAPATMVTGTTSALSATRYVRFKITKNNGVNVGSADRYKTANIIATHTINIVPEIAANQIITVYEGKNFSDTYGTPTSTGINRYPPSKDRNFSVSDDKKDFSTGDYVEFDYFVDDVVTLKEKLEGLHINIIASSNQNGVWVNYIDQITKNGWNHIKIRIDDIKHINNSSGLLNMTNVQYVRFKAAFKESALNVQFADRYAFANVCVTKAIPTDVMTDKVDFIGAEFKKIEFGDYAYSSDFTADITDARMIELDVYIEDNSNSTIRVRLADGSGPYAYYEFEDLTNGWNHLAIRIADMVSADELDKANITKFALCGAADTAVYVSNFYAADYLDGDGNRDEEVDIVDLVLMEMYDCDLGESGNVIAMDVAGNDYEIDSLDLTALAVYLLTDEWPED